MSRPYTVGLICARGGSKGVPRKNVRPLAGKALIGWAIETGLACPSIDRMVVSTDDQEIAEVSRSFGAEVPFLRPEELARDDSPELLSWKHVIQTLAKMDSRQPEVVVTIPATAPMRSVEDVEACIRRRQELDADLCLTVKTADRNPYFTMLRRDGEFVRMLMDGQPVFRRQDAPEVLDIVPVAYAARAEYILGASRLLEGKIAATVVPAERALDIDTELDFAFAEFMMARGRQ